MQIERGLALNVVTVEAFVASRRAAGYSNHLTSDALRPLLGYLRGLGVLAEEEVLAPVGAVETALESYRRYLLVERGLSVITSRVYVDAVRPFLAGRLSTGSQRLELRDLRAMDVTTCRGALPSAVARGRQADDDGPAFAAGLFARERRDRPAVGRCVAVGCWMAAGRFAEGARARPGARVAVTRGLAGTFTGPHPPRLSPR